MNGDEPDLEIEYDCTTWAAESRAMLAGLLASGGVRHVWQGTTVAVLPSDEQHVDELVEEVLASASPALDPAAERVVYEVGAWPSGLLSMLTDALTVADLPYEWDGRGDLVVYAEHEDEVEAILDEMPDPDDPDLVGEVSADDGIAVHDLLDRIFVASGRLAAKDDPTSIVAVDEATGTLERMGPPFGFEPPQWRAVVERAQRVRDALAAGPGDPGALSDDDLRAAARELRDLVRQYV